MYAVMVDPEDDAPLRPGRPQDAQKASRWGGSLQQEVFLFTC